MTLEPKEAIKRLLDGATNIEVLDRGCWVKIELADVLDLRLEYMIYGGFEYRTIETEEV